MNSSSVRRGTRTVAVLAIACLFAIIAAPGAALAASDGQVKLLLRPLDQDGAYFDLTMRAGETRSLSVEIGNAGDAELSVRTYAADVYTIINGGFGAGLRSDAQTGVTGWLDYSTDVLLLPATQAVHRTFAISVPADAAPGEYITSLVLENDLAVTGTGAVAINQFVRQAIAVVVTIPGLRQPALGIDGASHTIVAARSVVAVRVQNLGNIRLKPTAAFTLMDATGAVVSQATLPMDTFYATTPSSIEVPLAALLLPGTYTVHLILEDGLQKVRIEATRTFTVEAQTAPTSNGGTGPALVGVDQAPLGSRSAGGLIVVAVGGSLVGLASIVLFALMRRRRRQWARRLHIRD